MPNVDGVISENSLGNLADWTCSGGGGIDYKPVCRNSNHHAVAAIAERGELDIHSEQFILDHVNNVYEEDDAQRDLVIISTNTPCTGCTHRRQLEKMCNGIKRNERFCGIRNIDSHYWKCLVLTKDRNGNRLCMLGIRLIMTHGLDIFFVVNLIISFVWDGMEVKK